MQRAQYQSLVSNLLMVGGVLLLLGCANVANLLLSRGVRRQHELARTPGARREPAPARPAAAHGELRARARAALPSASVSRWGSSS